MAQASGDGLWLLAHRVCQSTYIENLLIDKKSIVNYKRLCYLDSHILH